MFRQVALPSACLGKLYLHHLPGRHEPMSDFIRTLREEGIDRIISLSQPEEIDRKAPEYALAISSGELPCDRVAFPIPDYGVPEDPEAFLTLARETATAILAGKRILIHCGAGIGRTGTLACSVLTALGFSSEDAFKTVEAAGSKPETKEQLDLVQRGVDTGRSNGRQ